MCKVLGSYDKYKFLLAFLQKNQLLYKDLKGRMGVAHGTPFLRTVFFFLSSFISHNA